MPQLLRVASPLRITSRGFRKPVRPQLIRNHPLNKGLVGCWLLGDVGPKGITADLCGVNPGTLTNSPTLAPSHHGGLALQCLAASNQYVRVKDNASLNFTTGSWWQWINPTNFAASRYSLNRAPDSNSAGQIAIQITSGAKVSVDIPFVAGAVIVSSSTIPAGAFTFIVVTKSGSNWAIWLNGKQDNTATNASAMALTGDLKIGAAINGTGTFALNGLVEGSGCASRVLSAVEIAWKYAEPYAGISDYRPDWRVGAGAVATFNPGWAYNATRTIGAGSVFQ